MDCVFDNYCNGYLDEVWMSDGEDLGTQHQKESVSSAQRRLMRAQSLS